MFRGRRPRGRNRLRRRRANPPQRLGFVMGRENPKLSIQQQKESKPKSSSNSQEKDDNNSLVVVDPEEDSEYEPLDFKEPSEKLE